MGHFSPKNNRIRISGSLIHGFSALSLPSPLVIRAERKKAAFRRRLKSLSSAQGGFLVPSDAVERALVERLAEIGGEQLQQAG